MTSRFSAAVVGVLVAGVVFAVAACGGPGPSPSTIAPSATPAAGVFPLIISSEQTAGPWTATFTTEAPNSPPQEIPFSFDVRADAHAVQPGEPAPSVDTPTFADV